MYRGGLKKWVIRKSSANRSLWPSIRFFSGMVDVLEANTDEAGSERGAAAVTLVAVADGDRRERAAVREDTNAVAHVGDQILQPACAALVAAVLLGLIETAELRRGFASRLGLAQAFAPVVGGLSFEVIAQLGVQLEVEPAASKQASPDCHESIIQIRVIVNLQSASRRVTLLGVQP